MVSGKKGEKRRSKRKWKKKRKSKNCAEAQILIEAQILKICLGNTMPAAVETAHARRREAATIWAISAIAVHARLTHSHTPAHAAI